MNRYADDAGFTFETVPFDDWSGRQCAAIVRGADLAAGATMADGLHFDRGTNHYPVVFVQTRSPLALPAVTPCSTHRDMDELPGSIYWTCRDCRRYVDSFWSN